MKIEYVYLYVCFNFNYFRKYAKTTRQRENDYIEDLEQKVRAKEEEEARLMAEIAWLGLKRLTKTEFNPVSIIASVVFAL